MTDLTDRMRTCAAYIMERPRGEPMPIDSADLKVVLDRIELVLDDAADLLIEASNIIEAVAQPQYPPGVPMEIVPPVTKKEDWSLDTVGTWIAIGDTLPAARLRSPHACPKCDSRANKRVRRDGNRLMVECPVCAETWEFER